MPGQGNPKLADIMHMMPAFAAAAQHEYDAWEQDADGYDEELGTGGICDRIAEAIVSAILARFQDALVSAKMLNDEVHVTVTVAMSEGVYDIDVPHRLYETGAGYIWRKIPGIVFDGGAWS